MRQSKDGLRRSLLAGGLAAVTFFVGFIALIVSRPDAQGAIGTFLSPFLAGWFGASVGLVFRGWQLLHPVEEEQCLESVAAERSRLESFGAIYLWFGILGIGIIVLWLWSEGYQATHPTNARSMVVRTTVFVRS